MDNQDSNASGEAKTDETTLGLSELDLLKQRATLLGVHFSNNIGLETLKERIRAKQEAGEQPAPQVNALSTDDEAGAAADANPQLTARQKMVLEQTKMVRVRIQNLDPKKKDVPGEIITVANEILGTVRKYIPYGAVTDDGWHIPYILYAELADRKFQNIRTVKNPRTGRDEVENGWAKEFSLDVLPPLTQDELDRLANAQAAAAGL